MTLTVDVFRAIFISPYVQISRRTALGSRSDMASRELTGSAVYDTVECAVNNDERGLGCGVGCGVGCRFIKS